MKALRYLGVPVVQREGEGGLENIGGGDDALIYLIDSWGYKCVGLLNLPHLTIVMHFQHIPSHLLGAGFCLLGVFGGGCGEQRCASGWL